MERRAAGEDSVCRGEDLVKRLHRRERAVGGRVQVREVDHRPHPGEAGRDGDHVVEAAEVVDPAHDLDAERDASLLALEPLAQAGELRDHRRDRLLSRAAKEETRVEDDRLGAGHLRDSGRVVEHAGRHPVLAVALDVAHESSDRRVHRERDPVAARELPELLSPGVLHPEPGLEVDLACRVPALAEQLDRLLRRFARRHACGAESQLSHS